jgi:3-mercaptopyruvate sulfurtransferase SseA
MVALASNARVAMKPDEEWVRLVKGILRTEMARRGMTYDQLAEKLAEIGVRDSAVNIRNKVARGGFTAVFFVQCLRAMGCKTVTIAAE